MDISADLLELGKTPVAVVCAGAKSILDIPKTLEVLVSSIAKDVSKRAKFSNSLLSSRKLKVCL
jgi:pseudouridine-5'-phosphate glycosidase